MGQMAPEGHGKGTGKARERHGNDTEMAPKCHLAVQKEV